MGTTSLVMTIARQLSVPGNLNLLGFVTLIYGIRQIRPGADQYALQWNIGACQRHSAARRRCTAGLSATAQLFKLQVVTS
ncbi:YbfB/YjiJ family MFS transporter [Shigella sonnei]